MHHTDDDTTTWARPQAERDPDRLESLAVRDAIVSAARRLFLTHGYHAVSVEQVAEQAQCSVGAVYSCFEDKPALFFQIVGQTMANPARAIVDLHHEATGDAEADRRTMAENVLDVLDRPQFNLLLAEFRATLTTEPEVVGRFAELREAMMESMRRFIVSDMERFGVEPRIPLDELATLLVSLTNGMALEHVGAERRLVSTESIMVLLDGLLRPVAPR